MSPDQIKDGGAAFPHTKYRGHLQDHVPGMSLRDWFAGQALNAGIQWCEYHETGGYGEAAIVAYEIADAMLAAREVKA